MYYVTMTDTFLSGWGKAKDRINKLIFICVDYEQAKIVAQNAENRSDTKYVNICIRFPRYNESRYYAQVKTIKEYPSWYKKGYF